MLKLKTFKNILLSFLAVILLFAAAFIFSLKGKYVPPILMYHSVNKEVNPYIKALIVSPDTFEKQMRFLKIHKYNVIPLEDLAGLIRQAKPIPAKTVVITLDDGFKDNYTEAFRVLKKYRLPATIFIIINEVGRADRLNWAEIKEMKACGLVDFGSHTMGPDPLIKITSREELKKQIFDSKKILEEKLGGEVGSFSYPEGMFNEDIRKLVIDAGYKCAVATKTGLDHPWKDVFLLKRLRISENCRNMFVFAAEISGYYTYIKDNKKRKHKKR